MSKVIGIDIETASNGIEFQKRKSNAAYLSGCSLRLVGLSDGATHTIYDVWDGAQLDAVRRRINHSDDIFVGVNLTNFDLPVLLRHGIKVQRPVDLRTISRLLTGGNFFANNKRLGFSLAELAKRHLGLDIKEEIDHSLWNNPELTEQQLSYMTADIAHLVPIYEALMKDVKAKKAEKAFELENDLTSVFAHMIYRGLPVDTEGFQNEIQERIELSEDMRYQIAEALGLDTEKFSLTKARSAREFYTALGIEPVYSYDERTGNRKVNISTDELAHAVEAYPHRAPYLRAAYKAKHEQSLATKFTDWLQTDPAGYLRPTFNSYGASTGRIASSRPNVHQLAGELKKHIRPDDQSYKVVTSDLSQIEARILALLINDTEAIAALSNPETDFFTALSQSTGSKRDDMKVVYYGTSYGGSLDVLVRQSALSVLRGSSDSVWSLYDASKFVKELDLALPKRARYLERIQRKSQVIKSSLDIGIGMGYSVHVPYLKRYGLKAQNLLNYPVQSRAAVMMKLLLREAHKAGFPLVNNVHDEVVSVVPEDATPGIEDAMQDCTRAAFQQMGDEGVVNFDHLRKAGVEPLDFVEIGTNVSEYWSKA